MKDLGPTINELKIKADQLVFEEISKITDTLDREETKETFDYLLGGSILLVETEEDLDKIQNAYGSSILHKASPFDVATPFGPNQEYIMLVLITNNSGGNTYIIPKEIANKCANIAKSIKLTNESQNENY